MAQIRLQLPGGNDLLPPANVYLLEDRAKASATIENDIYGNPTTILRELPSGKEGWTIGVAYVELATVTGCINAYKQHTELTLIDELSNSKVVVISDYPSIERHKSLTEVIYSVKLTLMQQSNRFTIPPVLSTSGPRLFGR